MAALLSLTPAMAFEDSPEVKWIKQQAIPLRTVEAGNGFADMQPLKKLVGDARIVSLGEATHGTREFFQMKHRMMEFLATEMGFHIFSIEANMPESYRMNEYVLEGKGDPKEFLKGMYFWTWNTEEVLDMIEWMRAYNKSGKGPVRFTGFDMQTPDVAAANVVSFVSKHDPEFKTEVSNGAEQANNTRFNASSFGVATAKFPVKAAAGKTAKYSGWIKTKDVADGYAGLWWRVDGPSGVLAFDNMQSRGVTGTKDWQRFEIELPVAQEVKNIVFGALLTGGGEAWFDDLRVELDGEPYVSKDDFDLEFEQEQLKGFFTPMGLYRVTLDSSQAHSGKQSLRMFRGADDPKKVSPKETLASWKAILKHMEDSRKAYQEKEISKTETEWAIQNARVVVQCMQGRTNEQPRDASMAENVKWILDQSPKEKIVLWAHNGHVNHSGYRGYEPMGNALRKMYGNHMVTFGFAFNRGSFQAIGQSQGHNGLRNFTVSGADKDTLDATLTATGVPLFALDMRAVPKSGPVADYFNGSHRTRSIGSMYSEESPSNFYSEMKPAEAFDVLLFVENTTAARKVQPLPSRMMANGTRQFEDAKYHVTFQLPATWEVTNMSRWGEQETTIGFFDTQSSAMVRSMYFKAFPVKETHPLEEIEQLLRESAQRKTEQRRGEGFKDYEILVESCTPRKINGTPALRCVSTYTLNGVKMNEHLTWIRTNEASALLFYRVNEKDLETFGKTFDQIADSVRLP